MPRFLAQSEVIELKVEISEETLANLEHIKNELRFRYRREQPEVADPIVPDDYAVALALKFLADDLRQRAAGDTEGAA